MNNPRQFFSPFSKKNLKNKPKKCVFDNPWFMVRNWYLTELGQALIESEKQCLNHLLEHVFGYNLVQLGCLDNSSLLNDSRTSFQYVIESTMHTVETKGEARFVSRLDELAIPDYSVDAVILPHTLEFEEHPHQILREVDRILVAEGKAIFLGFNPVSLWGFWHKYWELKNRISNKSEYWQVPLPSCGRLITQKRLGDWLQLLGFDIDLVNEYFYRPPLRSSALLKKLEFIEKAGQLSKLLPAGAYLMVATKRVSTLTPIRQKWKLSNAIIGSETAEPAGFKPSNSNSTQN